MRVYRWRFAPVMLYGHALLGVADCRAEAPTPPASLVAAVQSLIADSLRPQATASGVHFSIVPDTGGTWARALATTAGPGARGQATLELHLARAELRGDSAIVHARLVRCTPAVPGMNFAEHTVRLYFLQVDSVWRYRGRTTDMIVDGGCTA